MAKRPVRQQPRAEFVGVASLMANRKLLTGDALVRSLLDSFSKVKDPRSKNSQKGIVDVLMSAYALFSLEQPSLLAFDEERTSDQFQQNMKNLFGVGQIHLDTRMREVIDLVSPDEIRSAFTAIFAAF